MDSPIVYDKAKYHSESVETEGLLEGQEFVHTGFYLGLLIENDLLDDFLGGEVSEFKRRGIAGSEIYPRCDDALVDDMLDAEGNAFSQHFFDFEKGQFVDDYQKVY